MTDTTKLKIAVTASLLSWLVVAGLLTWGIVTVADPMARELLASGGLLWLIVLWLLTRETRP